jgi:hypothetical protein
MLSSYWLAHFYLMKKSSKLQLYFGSGCGMMKFFTCKPQSIEQLEAFLHGAAQNFKVFLKIQDQK